VDIIERELNKLFNTPIDDVVLNLSKIKGSLYEYQKDGIKFLVGSRGRAIIADSPGTGKSALTLGYIVHSKKDKILIVCPASMKYVWEAEVEKWTDLSPYVITSKDKSLPNKHNVFIINYDILKKFLDILTSAKWDLVIGDEGHMIKNTTAIRSKCFKKISKEAPEVIFLTGTPILSRPIELFNLLNTLDKKTWSNWWTYAHRYCAARQTRFGLDVSGASNLEELRQKIKKYFIRRTKKDVLKELPPKRLINIPVRLEGEHLKKYLLALQEFKKYLKEVKLLPEEDVKKTLQAEKLTRMGYLRQISSTGKVEYVSEMIDTLIDSEEKVIVFSNYNSPLQELKNKYKDRAVLLSGSTPVEERKKIIDSFQTNKNISVFLGGIKSAGVGITLTAASNIIFLDYSWVPADHIQASDRSHRPGIVADSVDVYQFFAQDTIDEYMKDVLEEKQDIINKLIGGEELSLSTKQFNIFKDVLAKIESSDEE
jgi:SWI/SNF-related matrix-associated actin-dependent regulator 1 of chromatin subfamily A